MLFAVHEMFPLAKTDVACKKKNTEQENVLNIVVHEMLCLAKTDVAWKRRANQFQLSVQQIYNTEIQFRVKSNFSFKRFFALSRHLFTKQKLSPGGKLIVHRLSLPCKKCTWAKLYGLHRLCNQTQSQLHMTSECVNFWFNNIQCICIFFKSFCLHRNLTQKCKTDSKIGGKMLRIANLYWNCINMC